MPGPFPLDMVYCCMQTRVSLQVKPMEPMESWCPLFYRKFAPDVVAPLTKIFSEERVLNLDIFVTRPVTPLEDVEIPAGRRRTS